MFTSWGTGKPGREDWCSRILRQKSKESFWVAAVHLGVFLDWCQNMNQDVLWLKRFQEASNFVLNLAVWLLLSCAENVTISFCTNTAFGICTHTNKSRSSEGTSQVTEPGYEFLIVSSLVIFFLQSLLLDTSRRTNNFGTLDKITVRCSKFNTELPRYLKSNIGLKK